jgi:hypothetical protein
MPMAVTYLSENEEGDGVAGILVQDLAHYYLQVGEQFSLLENCSSAISIDPTIENLFSYTKWRRFTGHRFDCTKHNYQVSVCL